MAELTEMSVDSVRVHSPTGQHVVVLKEARGERYLAISIGTVEANSIALSLAGMAPERPLTHDLIADILGVAEMQLKRVIISSPGNEIYHGRLLGEIRGRRFEIDARASDSVALALRTGAKMFVVSSTLERSSIDRPDGGPKPGEQEPDERPTVFEDLINSMDLPSLGRPDDAEG